jgi:hypothetical protein
MSANPEPSFPHRRYAGLQSFLGGRRGVNSAIFGRLTQYLLVVIACVRSNMRVSIDQAGEHGTLAFIEDASARGNRRAVPYRRYLA